MIVIGAGFVPWAGTAVQAASQAGPESPAGTRVGAPAAPPTPGTQVGAPAAPPTPGTTAPPEGTRLTDRVVIRWATTTRAPSTVLGRVAALGSDASLRSVTAAVGTQVTLVRPLGKDGTTGVYRLGQALGAGADETLAAVRAIPGVASVEPDVLVTADALPNDPYASQLWGMLGPGNGSAYGIDAVSGWSTTRGDGITVAVIDTGLVAHPDLAGRTVAGYDFVSDAAMANDGNGRDADASDPGDWVSAGDAAGAFAGCTVGASTWHGTHVAGTIAAIAGNATGVFGAAPGARVQPVRVLGKCGGYMTDIAEGIVWAAGGTVAGVPHNATPARVLNLSLGGTAACPSYVASAIATARSLGAVVVVAAGNDGADVAGSAPANCAGAFVVAATTQTGAKASFSNSGSLVDIAGPGLGILSTIDGGTTVPAGPTYASYGGTSMATPHVAALAALLAAAVPRATNSAVEAAITGGATRFPGVCAGCGAGIANVPAALALLAAAYPPPVAHTLTVVKGGAGAGTVTSSPAGISCGAACSASFDDGTPVTLSAAASPGSAFGGWSGGGCSGTGTCVVTMSAARSVTASFVAAPVLGTDARLSGLTLSGGALSPAFAPGTTAYAAHVANGVASVSLTATASDPAAGLELGVGGGPYAPLAAGSPSGPVGLAVGDTVVRVRVTAPDGVTLRITTVTVTRAAAPPSPDTTPPVTTAPVATIRTGAALSGTAVGLTLRWTGSDGPGGSGIARYQLDRSTNGGSSWTRVSSSLTVATATVSAASSGRVRYRVRAVDLAGNAGAWMGGPDLSPRLVQQSSTAVRWRGTWWRTAGTTVSGGSARYAKTRGASATYAFTGRGIALVTTRGSVRGRVVISVDGRNVATVDLRRSPAQYRSVAWQMTWSASRAHSIRVVVQGTAGRPRVDVDAFVVIR